MMICGCVAVSSAKDNVLRDYVQSEKDRTLQQFEMHKGNCFISRSADVRLTNFPSQHAKLNNRCILKLSRSELASAPCHSFSQFL